MAIRYYKLAISFIFALSAGVAYSNTPPQIHFAHIGVDKEARRLTITYAVEDKEDKQVSISLVLSLDNGLTFITPESITGDIGYPVMVGSARVITVALGRAGEGMNLNGLQVTLTADDRYKIDIKGLIDQVDAMRIKQHLLQITGERNYGDNTTTQHLEEVRSYLRKELGSYSLAVRAQDTTLSLNDLFTVVFDGKEMGDKTPVRVVNIIARKPGLQQNPDAYILSAHYDSAPGSPGANDNATGVASLLEVARIFSQYQFQNTIRFIGFDQEERDFLGSGAYVFGKTAIEGEKGITGVINLDMIGTYSEKPKSQKVPKGFDKMFPATYKNVSANGLRGDFAVIVANEDSKPLGSAYTTSIDQYVPNLRKELLVVPGIGDDVPQFQKSDHFVFWVAKYKSIHIGDGADTRSKFYHTKGDKPENVDLDFVAEVTKATLATLAQLAVLCHCSNAHAGINDVKMSQ